MISDWWFCTDREGVILVAAQRTIAAIVMTLFLNAVVVVAGRCLGDLSDGLYRFLLKRLSLFTA